jgi:hypothetical protein
VAALEEKNAVSLAADLRQYFLRLNGISEDSEVFCFWPLQRLKGFDRSAPIVLHSEGYFCFAD